MAGQTYCRPSTDNIYLHSNKQCSVRQGSSTFFFLSWRSQEASTTLMEASTTFMENSKKIVPRPWRLPSLSTETFTTVMEAFIYLHGRFHLCKLPATSIYAHRSFYTYTSMEYSTTSMETSKCFHGIFHHFHGSFHHFHGGFHYFHGKFSSISMQDCIYFHLLPSRLPATWYSTCPRLHKPRTNIHCHHSTRPMFSLNTVLRFGRGYVQAFHQ